MILQRCPNQKQHSADVFKGTFASLNALQKQYQLITISKTQIHEYFSYSRSYSEIFSANIHMTRACLCTRMYSSMLCDILFHLWAIISAHWFSQAIWYCHDSSFNRCIFPLFRVSDSRVCKWIKYLKQPQKQNKSKVTNKKVLPSLSNKRCFRIYQPNDSRSCVVCLNPPCSPHWSLWYCLINTDRHA